MADVNGDGQDMITDFEGLIDKIYFKAPGLTRGYVQLYDTPLGLQIVYGIIDVITISNATIASLPEDDLIFAYS